MFYIIYQITNIINGKIYIGVHRTLDLNDGYMGFGKNIRRAIKKYGKQNFTKDILAQFNNIEDMFHMESQLVNEDFLKRDDVYNIIQGGNGYISSEVQQKGVARVNYLRTHDAEWNRRHLQQLKYSCGKKTFSAYFKGKHHTDETKRKISEKAKIHQKGEKNSQFGKCWITKDGINKSIKKDELVLYVNDGWIKGRVGINVSNCQ